MTTPSTPRAPYLWGSSTPKPTTASPTQSSQSSPAIASDRMPGCLRRPRISVFTSSIGVYVCLGHQTIEGKYGLVYGLVIMNSESAQKNATHESERKPRKGASEIVCCGRQKSFKWSEMRVSAGAKGVGRSEISGCRSFQRLGGRRYRCRLLLLRMTGGRSQHVDFLFANGQTRVGV